MRKETLAIAIVLLLATVLRFTGIEFDPYHPDERRVVKMALRMLDQGTLDPGYLVYGSLTAYLQAAGIAVARTARLLLGAEARTNEGLLVARFLSAIAGVITVWLTALLARAVVERRDGSTAAPRFFAPVAALLVAVSFVSVQCAHYATIDTLMAMLATASVLMALRAHTTGETPNFVAAGLLSGMAMATKFTGILSVLALITVPLVSLAGERRLRKTGLGVLAAGVGFAVTMPIAVLAPRRLIDALSSESAHYTTGGSTIFAMGPRSDLWNLEYLYTTGLGPVASALAVLGLAWAIVQLRTLRSDPDGDVDPRRLALLLVYPASLFVFLSCFSVRFDRNLLPLIPFAAVLAALATSLVWRWLAHRPRLAIGAVAITIAMATLHPLSRDVVFDLQLRTPHTKRMLDEWAAKLPPGARVAPHRRVQPLSLAELQRGNFDFAVLSSHSLVPVQIHPERFPELDQRYQELLDSCEVEIEFRNPWFASEFFAPAHLLNSATVNVYHGPTLTVLRVPKAASAPAL
jgi:4-amino-4-deoxy-L-arabinose transferase-like glycosyltransferase